MSLYHQRGDRKRKSTPLWRRTPDRAHILCNACGLYYKQYKRHRPVRIWQRATRWLGVEGYNQNQYTHPMQQRQQQQQCANCHQTDTPLWRKNSRGQSICNACGLFFKLHHRDRPMELNKTNSQRRRRRRQEPLDGTRDMFMGLRANMSRDEMQLVLRIMEERCAFLKAMLGNVPRNSSNESSQQQEENFGYM
ncbi:glucocorticoid receptor-like (DNA-binding domain) [Lichtheimia hyalospora FSU 10163]|nr:glucocorticoid receptor-like (DNA-binding domain) [Lichtheimia hyalospora FSU 10163]